MYTIGQEKYTLVQTPITCARMHMTHFYFKKGYEKHRPFVVMSPLRRNQAGQLALLTI